MKNIFGLLFLTIILFSCKKDPKEGSLVLNMNHIVADKAFELNSEKYLSPTGHPYQITKLVYYISELSFIRTDGTEDIFNKGYLVDVAEESTLSISLDKINPGIYNKIKFQYGFKKSNNYKDYLPNTLENHIMYWFDAVDSLAYHYMKYEGKYDSLETGIQKQFKYHYGPTDGNDNSITVSLDIPEFEINDNSFQIKINMDLQECLQNPIDYNFPEYNMVMMHQHIQEIYKANAHNIFTFKEIVSNED